MIKRGKQFILGMGIVLIFGGCLGMGLDIWGLGVIGFTFGTLLLHLSQSHMK